MSIGTEILVTLAYIISGICMLAALFYAVDLLNIRLKRDKAAHKAWKEWQDAKIRRTLLRIRLEQTDPSDYTPMDYVGGLYGTYEEIDEVLLAVKENHALVEYAELCSKLPVGSKEALIDSLGKHDDQSLADRALNQIFFKK